MKKETRITCLSIDCPERKSLCCDRTSAISKSTKWGTRLICNGCGKEFKGGKCQGENRFKLIYKKCTCDFPKETAQEIGHFEGCPMLKIDFPMGVSQWKEYGKKWGYWDFFAKRITDQAKKYKSMPKNFINFIDQL